MPADGIIVSPNTNAEVVAATAAAGWSPGPAISRRPSVCRDRCRCDALKLFPAEGASPAVLKAQLAVLPKDCR